MNKLVYIPPQRIAQNAMGTVRMAYVDRTGAMPQDVTHTTRAPQGHHTTNIGPP